MEASELVEVTIQEIRINPDPGHPVVILRLDGDERILPIWIGPFEADAIKMALEGTPQHRPMTHDLMKSVLDTVDAKVISVVVTDMKDNTYYSKIHLLYEDSEYSIDSRPSDAIALALRTNAPIFANEDVIRKQASEELDQWLENLKPEDFGKYET